MAEVSESSLRAFQLYLVTNEMSTGYQAKAAQHQSCALTDHAHTHTTQTQATHTHRVLQVNSLHIYTKSMLLKIQL